eukprot:TRINITY_DN10420_c0_g1_i2.p1 TRINITY_DN10420_c0_g1~~TRINITY_DN10420_c0_g1_i2.p1  ORF type:complete len:210 (+),score=50.11 TRINITY_DN10420_c0_g1_i2:61-690(+)
MEPSGVEFKKEKALDGVGIWIEGAGYNPLVFWGVELVMFPAPASDKEYAKLVVITQAIVHDTTSNKIVKSVPKSVVDKVFSIAEKEDLFNLPCTDYTQDLYDDAYHMGVSVKAKHRKRQFYHQIPTGVLVLVSSLGPSVQHQMRFLNFVRNTIAFLLESVPGLPPIPEHVQLRWEARQKTLTSGPSPFSYPSSSSSSSSSAPSPISLSS